MRAPCNDPGKAFARCSMFDIRFLLTHDVVSPATAGASRAFASTRPSHPLIYPDPSFRQHRRGHLSV